MGKMGKKKRVERCTFVLGNGPSIPAIIEAENDYCCLLTSELDGSHYIVKKEYVRRLGLYVQRNE